MQDSRVAKLTESPKYVNCGSVFTQALQSVRDLPPQSLTNTIPHTLTGQAAPDTSDKSLFLECVEGIGEGIRTYLYENLVTPDEDGIKLRS